MTQKRAVSLALLKIVCPACDKKFAEFSKSALLRTFDHHIRCCSKLLDSKEIRLWRVQNILDEMLTMLVQDFMTDCIQCTSVSCEMTILPKSNLQIPGV